MRLRHIGEQTLWIVVVGFLLSISPTLATPWGYAAATAATILGPGHGLPDTVFSAGYLSLAERLLFTILAGLAIMVVATFVLLRMGVQLERTSVAMTVLGLTVVSSIASVLSRWRRLPGDPQPASSYARQHRLVFFAVGVGAGLLVMALLWPIVKM